MGACSIGIRTSCELDQATTCTARTNNARDLFFDLQMKVFKLHRSTSLYCERVDTQTRMHMRPAVRATVKLNRATVKLNPKTIVTIGKSCLRTPTSSRTMIMMLWQERSRARRHVWRGLDLLVPCHPGIRSIQASEVGTKEDQ
jgi:hypothetical protein